METKGKLTPLAQPHVTQATFREALDPRGVGIGSDPAGSRLSQGTEVGGLGTQTQRLFGMCFNGARCRMMSQEHVTITTRITLRCRSLGFRVKGLRVWGLRCNNAHMRALVSLYVYIHIYIYVYLYICIYKHCYIHIHIHAYMYALCISKCVCTHQTAYT